MQELPAMAGIGLANWNWRVVHHFVLERFGIVLSRSGCLNYLHRLGFAFKRPKKRLVMSRATGCWASRAEQKCTIYHQRSLASVNVRASCSGEVSQRQASCRLVGE